jgi:hypothetical protein
LFKLMSQKGTGYNCKGSENSSRYQESFIHAFRICNFKD